MGTDSEIYWKTAHRAKMVQKFDHLKGFLPTDFDTLLDIGGGPGFLSESISKWHLHKATILEVSEEALKQAAENGHTAVKADLDKVTFPFPDKSFDMVVAYDLLEHVRDPWIVLKEMQRVSRKYVFVCCPNFAWWKCRIDLLRGNGPRQMIEFPHGDVVGPDGTIADHIYFMTYTNARYQFEKLGLNIVSDRVFWYKRYTFFRPILERFFKNWGEQFQIVAKV